MSLRCTDDPGPWRIWQKATADIPTSLVMICVTYSCGPVRAVTNRRPIYIHEATCCNVGGRVATAMAASRQAAVLLLSLTQYIAALAINQYITKHALQCCISSHVCIRHNSAQCAVAVVYRPPWLEVSDIAGGQMLGWWQTVQVSCTRNSYENLGTRNLSVCHKFSCEFFLVRETWMD